jgi:predicted nucleic acid-binding protein
MKMVLLDTNIILDFILTREDFYANSEIILKSAFNKKIIAYITASSVTDIYYIVRKEKSKKLAKDFLSNLIKFIEIAEVNKDIIIKALNSDFKDFEDSVQECSAEFNGIDLIITRNTKDFLNIKTTVLNPNDFINNYLS